MYKNTKVRETILKAHSTTNNVKFALSRVLVHLDAGRFKEAAVELKTLRLQSESVSSSLEGLQVYLDDIARGE